MAYILIVEDEELVRRSMRSWLEQAGHQVEEATDGEAGLRLLACRAVDLVVTDILMPKLDGFELIREVRQHHPRTKVVAISGMPPLGSMTMVEAARRLGADDAISKPFGPSELLKIVLCCLTSDRSRGIAMTQSIEYRHEIEASA